MKLKKTRRKMSFEKELNIIKEELTYNCEMGFNRLYLERQIKTIIDLKNKHCIDREQVKEKFENALINYQEEATTKWSNEQEHNQALIEYRAIKKLKKELGL